MRFRAEQRLRRQADFRHARERGRRIECGGFTFWYVKRDPLIDAQNGPAEPKLTSRPVPDHARVGMVASTAAVGIAVKRNRAKRRLREVFRQHQLRVPAGYDLLLVARNSINRLSYTEIEQKFIEVCGRVFGGEKK